MKYKHSPFYKLIKYSLGVALLSALVLPTAAFGQDEEDLILE